MKVHRFIGAFNLGEEKIVLVDKDLVHQLSRVLRFQLGDHIQLCDGRGNEALVRLTAMTKHEVLGTIEERFPSRQEPERHVVLYVAILKRENLVWVAQKATEVGVHTIVPIVTRRTIKQDLRIDRLEDIVREAAEQSGRGHVPQVSIPCSFQEALAASAEHEARYFFHVDATKNTKHATIPEGTVSVFVGPEGGWEEEEVQLAREANLAFSSLGSFVLRGETAAIIATYQAVNGLSL